MRIKETKRLFVAINLPPNVKQELASIGTFLQHPFVRWTPKQNLHVTLHFIGQTLSSDIPELAKNISRIASSVRPFTMTLEKLKVIRKNRHPVMLWASLEENEWFRHLALQLQQTLPGDSGKLPRPHITLARMKRGKPVEISNLPELTRTSFEVHAIELMESKTEATGPVYELMGRMELAI